MQELKTWPESVFTIVKDFEMFASSLTNFIRLAKWFNVNVQNVLGIE